MKKFLSLLLAVMMVISLCPITAFADGANLTELPQVVEQEEQQEAVEPAEEQSEEPQQSGLKSLDLGGNEEISAETNAESGEGWDGTTVTEPTQADGVYQIGTAEELAWFAAKVNDGTISAANAVLTEDIDLNNKEWTPIGNVPNRYVGSFNGQNHTVKNMSITVGAEYIGLFGFAAKRTIENITVEGKIDIKDLAAQVKCGGLIGYLCSDIYDGDETAAGKVINCVSKVDITVSALSKPLISAVLSEALL